MLSRVVRIALCMIALWALSACQAFDRDQYDSLRNAMDAQADVPALDAATDIARESGTPTGRCLVRDAPADSGCQNAVFPSAPAGLQSRPGNGRVYVLGLKQILLGPGVFGHWDEYGFDLDRTCTSAEVPHNESCRNGTVVSDGQQGRDNSFGSRLGPVLFLSNVFRDTVINDTIPTGRVTLALRITEWSGGDDRSVTAEFLVVVQGRASRGGTLAWDGSDTWNIERNASFDGSGRARSLTREAFFACDWLVAKLLDPFTFYLPHGSEIRRFTLRNMHMAGALDPARGGVIDLTGMSTVADLGEDFDDYLCSRDPTEVVTVMRAQEQARDSLDIRLDLQSAPDQPCEAVSNGMRLEFAPITVVDTIETPRTLLHPCNGDGGSDAAQNDAAEDGPADGGSAVDDTGV